MTLDELDLNSDTYDEDLEQALYELPRTQEGMEQLWRFLRYDNELSTEGWHTLWEDYSEFMDEAFRKMVIERIKKVFCREHIQAVFPKCIGLTTGYKINDEGVLVGYDGTEKCLYIPPCKKIGWSVFYDYDNIVKVVIPEGVTEIGLHAFASCINLREVVLPNSLRAIYAGAFRNCINLERINFPLGLECIAVNAFENCVSLKKFYLPETTSVLRDAFRNCRFEEVNFGQLADATAIKDSTMRREYRRWRQMKSLVEKGHFSGNRTNRHSCAANRKRTLESSK